VQAELLVATTKIENQQAPRHRNRAPFAATAPATGGSRVEPPGVGRHLTHVRRRGGFARSRVAQQGSWDDDSKCPCSPCLRSASVCSYEQCRSKALEDWNSDRHRQDRQESPGVDPPQQRGLHVATEGECCVAVDLECGLSLLGVAWGWEHCEGGRPPGQGSFEAARALVWVVQPVNSCCWRVVYGVREGLAIRGPGQPGEASMERGMRGQQEPGQQQGARGGQLCEPEGEEGRERAGAVAQHQISQGMAGVA